MFQVDRIDITLPNKHYFDVDFSRFPKLNFSGCENNQVNMAELALSVLLNYS